MRRKRDSRGSVLLLVVGLLTIIAMLGGTYLLVSRLESRTAQALAAKNQADPIARGAVSRACAVLKADLYLDPDTPGNPADDAPYADVAGLVGSDLWKVCIDAPGTDFDAHIADDAGMSDLFGTSGTLVDTDGDGTDDAYLIDTGILDFNGNRYHVAVKLTDLSALVNINIAFHTNVAAAGYPNYSAPIRIDMRPLTTSSVFADINRARGSGTWMTPKVVHESIALHPLEPTGNGRPLSIGDEMCLRYVALGSPAEAGRLWPIMQPVGSAERLLLTTHNCARALPRYATGTIKRRLLMTDTANEVESNSAWLADELVAAGATNDEAAHFVVNLMAYLAGAEKSLAYNAKAYHSVSKRPFITEAYAHFIPETAPGAGDHMWLAAVELYNPFGEAIGLASYKLAGTDLSGNIASGGKRVFYNYGGAATGLGDFPGASFTGDRVDDADFTFYGVGTQTVALTRGSVPIDEVTDAEVGHGNQQTPASPAAVDDVRRDDDATNARCTVALYKDFAAHALGAANNVAWNDITTGGAETLNGGFVVYLPGAPPANLGDLSQIFITGPVEGGKALPQALRDLVATPANNLSRCRLNFLGADTAGPVNYPAVPWATVVAELLERIPPDETRDEGLPVTQRSRVYARINVNTATEEVLELLPYPAYLDLDGNGSQNGGEPSVSDADAAAAIIAYRNANDGAFATPGEVAVPLGQYADTLLGAGSQPAPGYLAARDSVYAAVSNCITASSDTYALNIVVQLRDADDEVRRQWEYVSVIDRSNCRDEDDWPKVALFAEVK